MPNWCANNAEFYNEDVAKVNELEARLKNLTDEDGLFSFCNSCFPNAPVLDTHLFVLGFRILSSGQSLFMIISIIMIEYFL